MNAQKSAVNLSSTSEELTFKLKEMKKVYMGYVQASTLCLFFSTAICAMAFARKDTSLITFTSITGIAAMIALLFSLYKLANVGSDALALVKAKELEAASQAASTTTVEEQATAPTVQP